MMVIGALAALCCSAALPAGAAAVAGQKTPSNVRPVTAVERRQVVNELASLLEREYVYPVIGARYAARLRVQLARGAYDHFTDPTVLGETFTSDLQQISPDGHLRVGPRESFRRLRPLSADVPASARARGPSGLEAAEVLPDNIAYLRFNEFPDDPATADKARAFLLAHPDARAIVIDCRPNRGGGMTIMNAILPLFYNRSSVQVRMDTRASAEAKSPTEPDPTLIRRPSPPSIVRYDHVVTPDPVATGLRTTPIYYLTSRRTASAAEHLALALKRNKRAVLVGEATAGANHYGDEIPLGTRFLAFVPVGRTYDPDTGQDWEGSGIMPDVKVPADDALGVALRLATKRPA